MDKSGKEIIPPIYQNIKIPNSYQLKALGRPLFAVYQDEQWGIINQNQYWMIPPSYPNYQQAFKTAIENNSR